MRKTTEIRRNEIVDSAFELMFKEGVQGITIKNIALKNNITEGAIYRHFKDKQSILFALIESLEKNLFDVIDVSIKKYNNPLRQLKGIMKTHMLLDEEKKRVFFSIIAESVHFNDIVLKNRIAQVITGYKSKINDVLQKACDGAYVRPDIDIEAVGLAFFGIIQTAIIQYAISGYQVHPVSGFDTFWNIFLKGIENKKRTAVAETTETD